jgi:hypothetical protein
MESEVFGTHDRRRVDLSTLTATPTNSPSRYRAEPNVRQRRDRALI